MWCSETHFWQREVCCFSHLAICQLFSDFPLVLVAWQPGAGAIKPWPVLFQAQIGRWFIGGTVSIVNQALEMDRLFLPLPLSWFIGITLKKDKRKKLIGWFLPHTQKNKIRSSLCLCIVIGTVCFCLFVLRQSHHYLCLTWNMVCRPG